MLAAVVAASVEEQRLRTRKDSSERVRRSTHKRELVRHRDKHSGKANV
jgi:hypothetical protein